MMTLKIYFANLPEDIIVDILTRLPIKSVGKCRCVSKQWQALLTNPLFTKKHFNTQKPLQQKNMLLTISTSRLTTDNALHVVDNLTVNTCTRKITLHPKLRDNWWQVWGSCHGLMLVLDHAEEEFLVNPTTCEQIKIPYPPCALRKRHYLGTDGIGYDGSADDYKVVRVLCTKDQLPMVDVYSVKTGVWKMVKNWPYPTTIPVRTPGAFCNGAVHWLVRSRRYSDMALFISAFDLAEEKFKEIPLPNGFDKIGLSFYNQFVALEGRLCIIDIRADHKSDMWIMREYGVKDSWEKFTIDVPGEQGMLPNEVVPLCFIGDQEILFKVDENFLIYHSTEKTLRPMVFTNGEPAIIFRDGWTFCQSILSPNSNKRAQEDRSSTGCNQESQGA